MVERKKDIQSDLRRASQKIAREVDLPRSLFSGLAHMELEGNKEAIVEGCGGVLEYEEGIITLDTGNSKTRFMGRDLVIKALTDERAIISGNILSIEFIT